MGRLKEWWMETHDNRSENIARALDITVDELDQLEYEIKTDSSKDGLVFGYYIEFGGNSSKDILGKIQRLIDGKRVYIEPWELDREYDYEEQLKAITENEDYFHRFREEMSDLRSLTEINVSDEKLKRILYRQVFVSVISAMETALSDAFINRTLGSELYFKNFIKRHPSFQKSRFELSVIFDEMSKLMDTAKKVMLDTNYHNLPVVMEMYESTFDIKFPDISGAQKFVLMRHDLVHRNGKTKDNKVVNVTDVMIHELMLCVGELVLSVENSLVLNDDIPF